MVMAVGALGLLSATGCGGGGGNTNGGLKNLYATVDEVYTDTGSISYVVFMGSPDVKELDYSNAIETSTGRATIGTVGGRVFVSGPDDPVVTRYSVSEAGVVTKEKDMTFAGKGEQYIDMSEWSTTFVSPTKAYTVGASGQTIVWNPELMEITGTIPFPAALERAGKMPTCGQGVVRGNRMVRGFGYADPMTGDPDPDSFLIVYDLDSDTVASTATELPCPSISNLVNADAAGNVYFSNWLWSVGFAAIGKTPKNCVLRMQPGSTEVDPTWTFKYSEIADGRDGAMFSPAESGKAVFAVLYDEELDPVDETTDPWVLAGEKKWRLWSMDLATKTTGLVDGLDWIIGASATYHLDGRVFTSIPMDGMSWATEFFEIKDNRAVPTFKARGWSFQLIKIR
jgi:hypothetical protein